ncbi:hypothetical protein IEQ34_004205 [Dendrobium chrysotoxum]|uniref:Uncharacterized protein n=1 Tax=Dendrobium chrysotoxum TaxID=161865 RepID=A0AAV7HGI3_DENCH|nr:hypothetical protein IEQ34_004205 [Dendrobium chrysotoxum]
MKRVLAARKEAEDLGVVEAGEADRAFETFTGAFEGGESEEGEGFYHRFFNTGRPAVIAEVSVARYYDSGDGEEVGAVGVAEFAVHEEEEG